MLKMFLNNTLKTNHTTLPGKWLNRTYSVTEYHSVINSTMIIYIRGKRFNLGVNGSSINSP